MDQMDEEAEIQHIKWIIKNRTRYDLVGVELLLKKLYRAKEILGAHHADLKPGERKFFDDLNSALS